MSTISPQTYTAKTGQTFVVRSAVPQDAQRMLAFIHPILAEGDFVLTTPEELQLTEEQESEWIRSFEAAPGKALLVAEAAGEMIGMLDFQNGARKRIAHQGSLGISVNRKWRDKGVGKALMESLISWGKREPLIEKLCLEVFANNERAIHLYASLGFVEEGRLVKDIKMQDGTYRDALLMGLWLEK